MPPHLHAIHTQFLQPPDVNLPQQIFTNNDITFSYSSRPRGIGHGCPMHTATEVDSHKRGDQRSTALRTRPNPRFDHQAFGEFLHEHFDLDNNTHQRHQKNNSQKPPRPSSPSHRTPQDTTNHLSPHPHTTNNLFLSPQSIPRHHPTQSLTIPPTIPTIPHQPTPHSHLNNKPKHNPKPFHTNIPIHTQYSNQTQHRNHPSNCRNPRTNHYSQPFTKTHKHHRIDVKHNSLKHDAYKHKDTPQHRLSPHPHQCTPDSNMTTPHTYISTHNQYTSIASHRHTQSLNNQRLKCTHYTPHHTPSYPNPPSQSMHNRIQTHYFNNRHINPTRHLRHTTQHFKHGKSGKKAPPKIFQKYRPPHLGQFYTQSKRR